MNKKIILVLDEIMDEFDFEKVKIVMDKLDWEWAFLKRLDPKDGFKEKIGSYVPTLDEIKQTAANLLWKLANDPNPENVIYATGGFRAERDFSDPENPWMRLSFEVTDWDACHSEMFPEDSDPVEEIGVFEDDSWDSM